MFADTIRSAELRHEIPVAVTDPIIYVERNGTRRVFASSLETPRLETVDGLEVLPDEELGSDELRAAGLQRHEAHPELVLRACRHAEIGRASVPRSFPLGIADHLRANGVELEVDGGIDAETAGQVYQAGAGVLVAGSAVFGAPEGVHAAITRLRRAVDTSLTSG